jgi:hypothetical protein
MTPVKVNGTSTSVEPSSWPAMVPDEMTIGSARPVVGWNRSNARTAGPVVRSSVLIMVPQRHRRLFAGAPSNKRSFPVPVAAVSNG